MSQGQQNTTPQPHSTNVHLDGPSKTRSPAQILDGLQIPTPQHPAHQVLEKTSDERILLHDFRPIRDSLEWELAWRYWATQGMQPFIHGTVPYTINNSGWASQNAAAVLFTNCCEASSKTPSQRIEILELGAGSGLFARQLLDAFQRLCVEHNKDFYDRLTYYVTDHSATTVQQWSRHELFAAHNHRVVIAQSNALCPGSVNPAKDATIHLSGLRAVFANYLLDSLPASIIRWRDGVAQQLCIRAYLPSQTDELGRHTDRSPQQIQALAQSDDPDERAQLLPILSYFQFEAQYRPDQMDKLSFLRELEDFHSHDHRVTLNDGAIHCLHACLDLLDPSGFVLINDYGPTKLDQIDPLSCTQRFGASLATSINFPFLEHYFNQQNCTIITPPGDEGRTIHARLLTHDDLPQTHDRFLNCYGDPNYIQADHIQITAVEHINTGRFDQALECFRNTLERCPEDWQTLGDAAQFLTQQLHKHDQALELAQMAVRVNPWSSAFIWNTLGNSLFCLGRYDRAHEAFLQARRVHEQDPQSHLNLSHTYARLGQYRDALTAVARGLEYDRDARFRDYLLKQQQQILDRLADDWSAHQQRETQRHTVFSTAR